MFVRAFSHPYPAVQFGKHIRVPFNNCINNCCLVADMAGPDSRVPESFAAMNSGDVESIGRHCQMEYCGKLDLLPFLCRNCNRSVGQATYRRLPQSNTRSVFCLDHRTESSHKCPCPGKAARLAQRNQAEGALGSSAPTTQTFGQSLPKASAQQRPAPSLSTVLACTACDARDAIGDSAYRTAMKSSTAAKTSHQLVLGHRPCSNGHNQRSRN